ncbi:hypothetical protein ALC56_11657 [Trachymyrmex septentrionalis]|uniref:DUF8207 domain-containing protein n=1 Tax=Trachymyrmex septentrionalis TaxID=34720 RepID=A0A151JTM7_9HYME|nr:hypothetical protein ALC56_11657 [Trachymyrmex septentrionalis]
MDRTKSISEREKTAKLIAKTRASIRKKHRTLKTDIMENKIVLEKQLKPIIEPISMEQTNKEKRSNIMFDSIIHSTPIESQQQQQQQQQVTPSELQDQEVFKIGDDPSLETSVRQVLSTPQGRQRLQSQLEPLGQVYMNTLLTGNTKNEINLVYGVYFDEKGTMLGNKKFDVDSDDTIIIDGVRYKGTNTQKDISNDVEKVRNKEEVSKSVSALLTKVSNEIHRGVTDLRQQINNMVTKETLEKSFKTTGRDMLVLALQKVSNDI